MVEIRRGGFAALALTAAAGFYGCSSAPSSDGSFDSNGSSSGSGGTSSGPNGTTDGAAGDDSAMGATGDDTTGGDSGAGSSSGTSGTDGAAAHDAGHHTDAASSADSGETPDSSTGATTSDASPDESAWLDPMNAARAAVDANEPPLTWNPIAAQVALAYANTCNYEHNPDRDAQYQAAGGGSGGLGENIAAGSPTLTIAGANMGWIQDEEPNYDYATNTCNTQGGTVECGHYTQIVWKTTTSVGCALVACTTNSPFDTTKYGNKWGFAVCDYAPPGNIVVNGTAEKPY